MKQIILLILITWFSLNIHSQTHYVFDGTGKPRSEKLAAMTVAGLVNRDEPKLFLKNVFETWSYNQTDEKWIEIFEQNEGVSFEELTKIQDLFTVFENQINGGIFYNDTEWYSNFPGQSILWQGEFAAMLGGLSNRIPVPLDKAANWGFQVDNEVILTGVEGNNFVMNPDLTLKKWPWNDSTLDDRYMSLLNWGIDNILPLCNRKSFFIREITDWAISQKMFQVDIAGDVAGSPDFYTLPENKAELLERLFSHFKSNNPNKLFNIYGWMQPEPLVQWFSMNGATFHESMQANLSWFHSFPAPQAPERASLVDPQDLTLQKKYYILFISSEGDAGNWNTGFQAGAWHSPQRGKLPIGWGFNLHFFETFPYLGYYYNSTATENDGFISVISPLGYTYGDVLPENTLEHAKSLSASRVGEFNIKTAYAYKHYNGQGESDYRGFTISNSYKVTKMVDFYGASNIETTFFFEPQYPSQTAYDRDVTTIFNHVNDNTFYGNITNLNAKAEEILSRLKQREPPYFYLAGYQRLVSENPGYTGNADVSLTELKRVIELIKADPKIGDAIEVVTPEKFNILLNANLGKINIPTDPTDFILSSESETLFSNLDIINRKNTLEIIYASNTQVTDDIIIYSVDGKTIYPTAKFTSPESRVTSIQISTTLLSKGVYILKIPTNKGIVSEKFIKQ
ncbi:GxGYxYP domain-containing protein [Mangrovivirga cuniculi]|uniref:Secretion system C-terminal sorting domain-containing protein n=1 Tax=Mangrovivirga cuniculi TaxID=2715131 RepID=A0A4D7JPV7_9BACT|nr:GxGYxYP domain-containing protein [Mangrovivirga cuniculi]QCK16813.1 hypothetical protein DCC35_19785 [Mangrovivirga cuniculi]